MRSRALLGALLAAAAVAAAGCGTSRRAAPPPQPPPQPPPAAPSEAAERMLSRQFLGAPDATPVVPSGYRVRRLTDAGFAVAFPPSWQLLQRRDAVWPGVAPSLARVNRGFAPYLSALVVPESPLKLFGFERRTATGFATTATLLVSPESFGAEYAEWSRGVLRELRTLPGLARVTGRHVRIPAGDALLVEYRRGRTGTLQLFAAEDGQIYTLTLTARAANLDRYRPMFLRVARSLDLSVPVLHP